MQDIDIQDSGNLGSSSITKQQQQYFNDSIIEGDESCVSSLSDISTTSKRTKWTGRHNRTSCLYCCRSKINRLHPRTDSDINIQRRKSHNSSTIQLSDVSFNSPESVFSEESMPDRITANILRHVQRMANPVWCKTLKLSLLELKQKHPHSFQDICLYSEVCKSLGKSTYRLNARRFLQELFLDLDFDCFYNEATEIISRKDRERELNITSNDDDDDEGDGINFRDNITEQLLHQQLYGRLQSSGGSVSGSGVNSNSSSGATYNNIKAHLKSPPLASVYEASAENLSESFGSKSTSKVININNNKTSNNNLDNINTTYPNNRRPRFHTIDLELRCTKNKFPITERRKKYSPPTSTASSFSNNTFKSLSSSITTPTGSLYCEKRLEISRSETTLSKK